MYISVQPSKDALPIIVPDTHAYGKLGRQAELAWKQVDHEQDFVSWFQYASSDEIQGAFSRLKDADAVTNGAVIALAACEEVREINPPLAVLMLSYGIAWMMPEREAKRVIIMESIAEVFEKGLITNQHKALESFPSVNVVYQKTTQNQK